MSCVLKINSGQEARKARIERPCSCACICGGRSAQLQVVGLPTCRTGTRQALNRDHEHRGETLPTATRKARTAYTGWCGYPTTTPKGKRMTSFRLICHPQVDDTIEIVINQGSHQLGYLPFRGAGGQNVNKVDPACRLRYQYKDLHPARKRKS